MKAGFTLVEYILYVMVMSFVIILSLQLVTRIHSTIKKNYTQINNARAAAVVFQSLARDIFFTESENLQIEKNNIKLTQKDIHIWWYLKGGTLYRKVYNVGAQTTNAAVLALEVGRFSVKSSSKRNEPHLVTAKILFAHAAHPYKYTMKSGWFRYTV